mgnify:FL=1|tara:strand:+ start:648 stop:1034 length:387 start_codon:yes stop_codon:yes gene_type:complete
MFKDGFASAQRAYDNLTPDDFGPDSTKECDRCPVECSWDDLEHDDENDLYVCKECLADGGDNAVGDEWRRACADCSEFSGAALVTKEGWGHICWPCRQERAAELLKSALCLLDDRSSLLSRRGGKDNG